MTRRLTYSNVCATLALLVAVAAGGPVMADSITEPDAYLLEQRIADQDDTISVLQSDVQTLDGTLTEVVDAVNELSESVAVIDCLAYSDFHYYRERVGTKGPRYRLPVMVWNTSIQSCRGTKAQWTPKRRALTPARSTR